MRFIVEKIEMRDPAEVVWEGEAEDESDALRRAGYEPDGEGLATSGAEPRNEWGNPWYPHMLASVDPDNYAGECPFGYGSCYFGELCDDDSNAAALHEDGLSQGCAYTRPR